MLAAKAGTKICSRLMESEKSGLLLFTSTEILWNLLENGVQDELADQLSDISCIRLALSIQVLHGV